MTRCTVSTVPSSIFTTISRGFAAGPLHVPERSSMSTMRSPAWKESPRRCSGTSKSERSRDRGPSPASFSAATRSTSICCQTSNSSSERMMSSFISSSVAASASIFEMSSRRSSLSIFSLSISCASRDDAPTLNMPLSMTKSPMRRRADARLSIRSSTVLGVISRITSVCFVCPIRLMRALACSSIMGFQSESKMMTVSAV
mmetsp:Transcript_57528/g.136876  ORF Transcript_57528/g.136876 Transcript_57528/m.136876 type:complete len:201 (-) Transcript_57528:1300-1902(-)